MWKNGGGARGKHAAREGGRVVRVSEQMIERAHARMRKNDSEGGGERKRVRQRKDRRKERRNRKRRERKRQRARVGECHSE